MSELINNREYRQKILKEVIREIHAGKTVEEVKPRFAKAIKGVTAKEIPGHPVHTMRLENQALEEHIDISLLPNLEEFKSDDSRENILELISDINLLWDIDKHYSRKENLIFPYLERYGITAPPQVMWGVDDEIRAMIKRVKRDYCLNKVL